jgi:hypothetical protein
MILNQSTKCASFIEFATVDDFIFLAPLHFLFSIEKSNGFTKPGGEALSAGQTAG